MLETLGFVMPFVIGACIALAGVALGVKIARDK